MTSFEETVLTMRFAGWTAAWLVVWLAVMKCSTTVHTVVLCIVHGFVATATAAATLYLGSNSSAVDSVPTITCSLAYFLVDGAFLSVSMKHAPPLELLLSVTHHLVGIAFAVCVYLAPGADRVFVWLQTNEASSPFWGLYRLTRVYGRRKSDAPSTPRTLAQRLFFDHPTMAGILFALSFFVSRILINTAVVLPLCLPFIRNNPLWALCLIYFALQYIWFYKIIMKVLRPQSAEPKWVSTDTRKNL